MTKMKLAFITDINHILNLDLDFGLVKKIDGIYHIRIYISDPSFSVCTCGVCMCLQLFHAAEGEDEFRAGRRDDELGAWSILYGSQRLGHE